MPQPHPGAQPRASLLLTVITTSSDMTCEWVGAMSVFYEQ
ncbi:hypothetical protein NPIL_40841, partial [Nephila pilipes]